jgi:hypothetical protein
MNSINYTNHQRIEAITFDILCKQSQISTKKRYDFIEILNEFSRNDKLFSNA